MLSPSELKRRSDFFQAIRSFFLSNDYVEVDTPIRLPVVLPEAEIIPFTSDSWWLQTSPELCMKRLLAQGAQQLFQICHCFRRHEIGRFHETEFTLLEWYHVDWDYRQLMDECEQFLQRLASEFSSFPGICSNSTLQRNNRTVSLDSPWPRMSVDEAFREYAGLGAIEALQSGQFEEILVTKVEPNLGWQAPVFLYDYPVELGSLARKKKGSPHLVERFELYLCGIELANGFSELTDPEEQRKRFTVELEKMHQYGHGGELPEKFLQDLEMVRDTGGIALGVDRLLMLFLNQSCIADVLPFSQNDL